MPFTNLSQPFLHILEQNLHMVCILGADDAHDAHLCTPERISKEFGVDAWSWLRTEEGASSEAVPQIIHMRSEEDRENAEEHQWRMKAVDLLGRMTDLLENLLKGKTRGG